MPGFKILFPQPIINHQAQTCEIPRSATSPHFVAWGWKPMNVDVHGFLENSDRERIDTVGVFKRPGFWVMFFKGVQLKPGDYTLVACCLDDKGNRISGTEESQPFVLERGSGGYGPVILTPGDGNTISSS